MDSNQQTPDFFSISEGGPVHHTLARIGMDKKRMKLIIAFLCIAWLPLLIITAVEGTICQIGQQSFLADVGMQVRLLLGLPMLLLIGYSIDSKVIEVQKYFSETLMSDHTQQHVLSKFLLGCRKLANSAIAEIILFLIVIAVTISVGRGGLFNAEQGSAESWKLAVKEGENVLSFAAKWAYFISVPLFQFTLIRWLWRYIIWSVLMFRLSGTRLSLQATHPDKAGGLGILMHAQKYFNQVFIVISIVISGELTEKLIKDPGAFAAIRSDGIAYILICLFIVLLPMVFFVRKLINAKEEGLLKMSKLGSSLSNKFEEEWINDHPIENKTKDAKVSTSDLQDYDTIYVSLEELRFVPFTVRDVMAMGIVLFIPYIPILLIHFSIGELLQKLFGLLL